MPRAAREIPALTQAQVARFWAHVDKHSGGACWLWLGARLRGYGVVGLNGQVYAAHRVTLALSGALVPGLVTDRLCRRRDCVLPSHLEQITNGEKTLRGLGPAAMNARKALCLRGHPLTPTKRGRTCRLCRRERERLQRANGWRRPRRAKQPCPVCLVQLTASERCRPCGMRATWQRPEYAEQIRADRASRRRRCLRCGEQGLGSVAKYHPACWKAVRQARAARTGRAA